MQEDSGVAKQLLDAEVEHHTIAAVEFHGVLANLENFFGGEYFDHIAKLVGVCGTARRWLAFRGSWLLP